MPAATESTSDRAVRVLIVDDQAPFRAAARAVIARVAASSSSPRRRRARRRSSCVDELRPTWC